MGDEKLKQELLYMVKLADKYDFSNLDVVESILRLENERQILNSVFGKRFKTRIFDIATGVSNDGKCVICGQPADNNVICKHCMETIAESNYAKNIIKNKENKIDFTQLLNRIKAPLKAIFKKKVKPEKVTAARSENNTEKETVACAENNTEKVTAVSTIFQKILVFGLSIILIFQLWILFLWITLPEYNPIEEPKVSSIEPSPVSNADEALASLARDFPEDEGYTLTFARKDDDFVGRFLLDKGECCLEVEENLTDEERYDYFFAEDVYVIYISLNEQYCAKVGMAEINSAGSVIVMGSFNDGRRTDSFYKYR